MWDMKDQGITAVAVNSATMELATGCADGSITLWSCEKWSKKMSFKSKLGGQVLVLRYGTVKSSKLPPSFIMVCTIIINGMLVYVHNVEISEH